MTIDRAINLLVTLTLIEMMLATGLGVTWAELVGVGRNGWWLFRALLANYVAVPLATVGLLLLFQAQPLVAAGFLMLAVCPGAPFIPPLAALAKGDAPAAVGLMGLLATSSAVVAPLLLGGLLPLVAGNTAVVIAPAQLVTTLIVTQLAPLCLGLGVRHWLPGVALRLQHPAHAAGKVLSLLSVGGILATQYPLLATIQLRGLVGMAALGLVSVAIGWLLGGPERGLRRTLALTTVLRNVGVSLVIATGAFPGTPAVTAVIAYGLFGIAGSLMLAGWWGRTPVALGPDGGEAPRPPAELPSAREFTEART